MAKLPDDFPGRTALANAGVTTFSQLEKADVTSIPDEATAAKITEAQAAHKASSPNEVEAGEADSPEVHAAAVAVEDAQTELSEAEAEAAIAAEKIELAKVKVDEAKAALNEVGPPKTYFVYDSETVLEAEVLKEHEDGAKDLAVSNVMVQKFTSGASSAQPSVGNRTFLRVRKGFGRADVGAYFVA